MDDHPHLKLTYRLATQADLLDLVHLLADDALGVTREQLARSLPAAYTRAFRALAADQQQELTVVEWQGELVATFQLSFIQYLTHLGGSSTG
jgi:ketosteroid isomerase-like protein